MALGEAEAYFQEVYFQKVVGVAVYLAVNLGADVAEAKDVAKLKVGNQLPTIRMVQTTHNALVGARVVDRVLARVVFPRKVDK